LKKGLLFFLCFCFGSILAIYLLKSIHEDPAPTIAQKFHSAVISEIEASDFLPQVIENCKKKAKDSGYNDLTVTIQESEKGNYYAEVVLDYNYSIPIINFFMNHQIIGYAR